MRETTPPPSDRTSRRKFLKNGTAALAGTALAANLPSLSAGAYAAGADTLKVGLVGCGGRGTGAASQALSADPNVQLVAMGDAFRDKLDRSLAALSQRSDIAERVKVDEDHKFAGLDAYKQVIESVDVVLLATPPGFRPVHLRAAVEAGKHIFAEKPMATDAVGARSVFESVRLSKEKNLALLAGFCWRYDSACRALFEKVHSGAIGEVRTVYGTYLTGPVKPMPAANTRPEGLTDLQWMVRNWYNFTWLSGDGFLEQACHTVDWVAWAFGDKPPVSCTAVGGRQIPSEGGNIYDHVEVNYIWENGARGFVAQRQINGCYRENNLYIIGARGIAEFRGRKASLRDNRGEVVWKYDGAGKNMYQQEHDEFFAAIRSGAYFNNGDRMAQSTLIDIMGRTAGYTGRELTWEMAMNSQERRVPEFSDGWNTKVEVPPIALPGLTKFV